MENLIIFVSIFTSVFVLVSLLTFILTGTLLAGRYLVVKKLGDKGWKGLVPLYGTYIMFEKTNTKMTYFYTYIIGILITVIGDMLNGSFVSILISFLGVFLIIFSLCEMYINLAKCLNIGIEYVLGLILLDEVFLLLIGLDKSASITDESKDTKEEAPLVKICPKCEKEIPVDAAFCQYCGQDQSKKVRKKKTAE